MLSLRSQVKEDLQCSPADLVFGQPLVLPGQFLSDSSVSKPSSAFIQYLQSRMSNLSFTPTRFQTKDIFVPESLSKCNFVFIRQDAVKRPLTPSYTGPFRVLARHSKFYTVLLPSGRSNISIDRLKPAYVEQSTEPDPKSQLPTTPGDIQYQPQTPAPKHTKKGRKVHWPSKYKHYITYWKKTVFSSPFFQSCGGYCSATPTFSRILIG